MCPMFYLEIKVEKGCVIMVFKEAPKSWRERRKKESCPIGKAMMHSSGGKRRKADSSFLTHETS